MSTDTITKYPLAWPAGWPRKTDAQRAEARFGRGTTTEHRRSDGISTVWRRGKKALTVSDGTNRVLDELARLGARPGSIIISTNVAVRLDGLPRSGQRAPADPGAAVYWQDRAGAPLVIAIDQYRAVADNLAAIAATLGALRAIERHGGAQILDRAFTGFTALPSPAAPKSWREVIGVPAGEQDLTTVRAAYRRRAQSAHPDRGGSHDEMATLTAAMRQAEQELGASA